MLKLLKLLKLVKKVKIVRWNLKNDKILIEKKLGHVQISPKKINFTLENVKILPEKIVWQL
jgi:hypothetical protein